MTRLLDYPEAMVLPWHEVLEPCLNCLSGPSSDSEVPDPWQGLEEGRQKLGHHLLGETLGSAAPYRTVGLRALWYREEGEKGQSRQALLFTSQGLYTMRRRQTKASSWDSLVLAGRSL